MVYASLLQVKGGDNAFLDIVANGHNYRVKVSNTGFF